MSPPLPLPLSPSLPLFPECWLGLMIGNSRLHWAWFADRTLHESWDTEHLSASDLEHLMGCWDVGELPIETFPPRLIAQWKRQEERETVPQHLPIYLASVVPTQTLLWQTFPGVRVITLEQIPLQGIYPTLGIDRALALWGAGQTLGWPILVIDAGTALTLTGADADQRLVGGAIFPGVRLQLQSLAQRTAALPEIELPSQMPQRWAVNTPSAIQSGIIYTILAGIKDFIEAWWQEFPSSRVVVTGGDRTLLLNYLQSQYPKLGAGVTADPHLIFWGIQYLTQNSKNQANSS